MIEDPFSTPMSGSHIWCSGVQTFVYANKILLESRNEALAARRSNMKKVGTNLKTTW